MKDIFNVKINITATVLSLYSIYLNIQFFKTDSHILVNTLRLNNVEIIIYWIIRIKRC